MWPTMIHIFFSILIIPHLVLGNDLILQSDDDKILQLIINIVKIGKVNKDWNNILTAGTLSDALFKRLQEIPSTFTVIIEGDDDVEIDDVMTYAPHTAFFKCRNFEHFEELFMKTVASPYWHPLTNVILFYESRLTNDLIAKIFFILLYHKACNVVIIQVAGSNQTLRLTHYNPYLSGNDMHNLHGCRTARKIGIPPSNFDEGFVCEEGCHNVTQQSKFRANNLGICIAFQTQVISFTDHKILHALNLFEDLGKNLHGFSLRAYTSEEPFLKVQVFDNGTYKLGSRDGTIWNTISKVMNFSIDLSPNAVTSKIHFAFDRAIQQIFGLSHRKADLFLVPIYQFDFIVVDLDYTFPIRESGLCLMGHRAGFETSLFDAKLLSDNYELVLKFVFCFVCIWILFFIFNALEKGKISLDQAGKDLVNAFRNILSISLFKEPKSRPFRLYLATSIWCFFVLNFFTQAAIISFFSSFRRGKEVNTFEDVIEKGYPIEGLASPDAFLPETEERFIKLNSKVVGIQDIFECVNNLINDSRRFCLVDCAVGHYLERNELDNKGEQYLHVARKDKVHSHYLNMIFPKHSPLTKQYDKIVMRLFEAGLIKKWEEYKLTHIKEEAQVKPLTMEDLLGIFICFGLLLCLCVIVFFVELFLGFQSFLRRYFTEKITKWKRTRITKKKARLEKKMGMIKQANASTQTSKVN